MNSSSTRTSKRTATGWVVAAMSLAGAIVALALPGRRQAGEIAPAGTVPALEAEARS
jgi:hypothetical protein